MTDFNELGIDELGANKIARSATAFSLYNNPVAIAQRTVGAPWLNGIGAIQQLTGSGDFTVPAGVYRLKVTAKGAGGSTRSASSGGDGGNTTFGGITATGGKFALGGTNREGGLGGVPSASTGVLSESLISGANGHRAVSGSPWMQNVGGIGGSGYLGQGGQGGLHQPGADPVTVNPESGRGFGAGGGGLASGAGAWGGGGEGATVIAVMAVAPGDLVAYAVGAGGVHSGGDGAPGTIIVEY